MTSHARMQLPVQALLRERPFAELLVFACQYMPFHGLPVAHL